MLTLDQARSWMLRLVMILLLGALTAPGCAGCGDEVDPAGPDLAGADEGPPPSEMGDPDPADMGPGDMPAAADMPPEVEPDMRRRRPDMPIGGFDFGPIGDMAPPALALEAVIPPTGPVEGGTRVRFRGGGLREGTSIFFDGRPVELTQSASGWIGTTPPASAAGPVDVKAVAPDGRTVVLEEGFTYTASVALTEVTPRRVPTRGGVQLEVRGQGFEPRAAVSFAGTSALSVEYVSPQLLFVLAPPRPAGAADVRVTTPGGDALLEDAVEYFEPLALARLEPASGLPAGGESVVLYGRGFDPSVTVSFDGQPAPVVAVDVQAGTLEVLTPAHAPGVVPVTVFGELGAARLERGFYYRPDDAARITDVRPGFGSTDGGDEVVVTGWGLDDAGTRIVFGDQPATVLERQASWARVQTPPGAPGLVDVRLEQGGAELDALTDGFDYREAIGLELLSPDQGPAEGGTEVTLQGPGVGQAQRVRFGGLSATVVSRGTDELVVQTPAHSAGPVDVVVERDGLEARLAQAFEYTEELQVWGFEPTRGAVAGGTYVRVRGQGFTQVEAVSVGGVDAPVVRRQDRHTLYLRTPPGQPGEVDLQVRADGQQAQGPYSFQYFNPASRFGGASGGSVDGAVNVTVLDTSGRGYRGCLRDAVDARGHPLPGHHQRRRTGHSVRAGRARLPDGHGHRRGLLLGDGAVGQRLGRHGLPQPGQPDARRRRGQPAAVRHHPWPAALGGQAGRSGEPEHL